MRVIGVCGILSDGTGSTREVLDQLITIGYDTYHIKQRRRSWISARWSAEKDCEEICDESKDSDVIVAHSYGCLKSLYAARFRKFSFMFLFAPAVARTWEFDELQTDPDRIYSIHSKYDGAIRLGNMLLKHPFGDAGRHGFLDHRVHNVRADHVKKHSGYFVEPELSRWVAFIDVHIKNPPPEKETVCLESSLRL